MKLLTLILILFNSVTSNANQQAEDAVRDTMRKDICVLSQDVANAYSYRITKKWGKHKYEMTGIAEFPGGAQPIHAILETTTGEFKGTGLPAGIMIQYDGFKNMPLENGFDAKVDIWKECDDSEKPVVKKKRPNFGSSQIDIF